MRKYEILLLLDPSLNKEKIEKLLTFVEKTLDGKIVKKEEWGLRNLMYNIKKQSKAYYVLYYIEANPENILTLKNDLLIKKEVLRNMILVHEKKWPFEMKTTKDLIIKDKKSTYPIKTKEKISTNDK